jgi:hypothetical protein
VFSVEPAPNHPDLVQLVIETGPPGTYWMKYHEQDQTTKRFQFFIFLDNNVGNPLSCMITEFISTNGALLTFDEDLKHAYLPGEFPDQPFLRS